MPKTIAILLAGGEGVRFDSTFPKQFQRLAGKRIYLHTVDALHSSSLFAAIVIVVHPEYEELVRNETKLYPSVHITTGAKTRQESSYRGLLYAKTLNPDLVLIHDAVRPFVSHKILKENIDTALQWGAADTCIPSADTLVHAPDSSVIHAIPTRSHFLRGQTPQTFQFSLILNAHVDNEGKNATDDCSLVLASGHKVHIVTGSEDNMKITTSLDLILAEQIFKTLAPSLTPSSLKSLKGKRIAVTGGSGGIGSVICSLLEEEGAIPLPISRASIYTADLTLPEESKNIFQKLGQLDGLINSIGALTIAPLQTLSEQDILEQISTNFLSVVYACKYAQLKADSHILNIASSSYLQGKKNYTLYSSSKAALVNFSQGLAQERPDLYVNTLCPHRANTSLRTTNFPHEEKDQLLDPKVIAQEAIALLKTTLTGATIPIVYPSELKN